MLAQMATQSDSCRRVTLYTPELLLINGERLAQEAVKAGIAAHFDPASSAFQAVMPCWIVPELLETSSLHDLLEHGQSLCLCHGAPNVRKYAVGIRLGLKSDYKLYQR